MSDHASDRGSIVDRPGILGRIGRVVGIVLVFVLLGPPVGALVFMTGTALIGLGATADLAGLGWIALFAVIYAVPFSYFIGAIPAAAAGLMVGIRQAFFGPASWLYAATAGLLVGVALLLLGGQQLMRPGETVQVPVILLICLVPTLVCWLVVRGWHVATALAAPAAPPAQG